MARGERSNVLVDRISGQMILWACEEEGPSERGVAEWWDSWDGGEDGGEEWIGGAEFDEESNDGHERFCEQTALAVEVHFKQFVMLKLNRWQLTGSFENEM